jgi:translation initiation factor IF-2
MTDNRDQKKPLTLSKSPDVKKTGSASRVQQSFSHGRTKTVAVEVRRKRVGGGQQAGANDKAAQAAALGLTVEEWESRVRAVQGALRQQDSSSISATAKVDEDRRRLQQENLDRIVEQDRRLSQPAPTKESKNKPDEASFENAPAASPVAEIGGFAEDNPKKSKPSIGERGRHLAPDDDEEELRAKKSLRTPVVEPKRVSPAVRRDTPRRSSNKISVYQVDISSEDDSGGVIRKRSMASMRRARERERQKQMQVLESAKIIREVIIPETISVQDLANRMAVRGADLVKSLMQMGMMVTVNQVIDADIAELLVTEFGHTPRRVSAADVEVGLTGEADTQENLLPRAPVVTVMGHVDHGKTSLLDALRQTDIAAQEAGGITQHIGAYQVTLPSGKKITFIDTPGHAAFTEMRARGANVTDLVILVVAADDGVKEQTVEAINHAKAAKVPMIVAINKIDKHGVDPSRVRTELLQHNIVVESLGGDVLEISVSARNKTNLDKLEELILLQAEMQDLRANPNRLAQGRVIEAKVERGRGPVATILVQNGTLRVGDVFVAGQAFGRVRALSDDHGRKIMTAGPSVPVEVLGFDMAPSAGDDFYVVENEARAREVVVYRQELQRDQRLAKTRNLLEQRFAQIGDQQAQNVNILIKADVQGSAEALATSFQKLATSEVRVHVLHIGVGGINESDVSLARASNAVIIGFNVRANPQARELSRRDGIDIRYYSIIYDAIDDVKAMMSGMLSPILRENFIGNAEIREVFNVTKIGKIAGCMITQGIVRRGAKVRLLRDNVVIHEGMLKTLKRFKDEVKEVRESMECGMAFESYQDIRVGDVIECFEVESIARQL